VANLSPVSYATSRPKSRLLCEAFAQGCGGRVVENAQRLEDGPAAFYGVRPLQIPLWNQCKAEARDWFYMDNSWFDVVRQQQFRITHPRSCSERVMEPVLRTNCV